MVRTGVCLGLLAMSLGALPLPAAADGSRSGKIEEARERMRESSSDDDDDDDDYEEDGDDSLLDDDDCEDCEPSALDQAIGSALFYALAFPFWAPQMIVGDWQPTRSYNLQLYPYAEGSEGPFEFLEVDEQGKPYDPHPFMASLRVMASYERHGQNLDGRRLRMTLRTNFRVGLDASITRYTEALGPDDYDALWHYHGMFTGAFAVSPRTQFTVGLGARGIVFSAGDHYMHFATHYGAEFFPVRPLHLWLLGEASIGKDTWSTEVEAGLGVMLHRFEVFGGYRHFRLQGVDFAGPEVGVIAWF